MPKTEREDFKNGKQLKYPDPGEFRLSALQIETYPIQSLSFLELALRQGFVVVGVEAHQWTTLVKRIYSRL